MTDDLAQTRTLLERWHGGDRSALDHLVARDVEWIRTYVKSRLGDLLRGKADVDDYVQDAIVEVLRYGPRFVVSNTKQFRALLAKITENVLRDHAVALGADKRNPARERAVSTDTMLDLDPPVGEVTRPSVAVQRDQEKSWIRLGIELLPAEERDIVRWREWDALSFQAIGERLGLNEAAARMRYNRALPKLAKQVDRLRRGEVGTVLEETMGQVL